ncbi:hypothetical protein Ddye_027826 [Dipteronia dyeriana]|uniref:Uncharacterized protein n=1 Tax=Dipteronia dyeriana TaxID=168575 RepID=A0AAD9TQ27_9ROSI|nr:hypothetical protein Ddye_027826 [Dipteronia dyeriana]
MVGTYRTGFGQIRSITILMKAATAKRLTSSSAYRLTIRGVADMAKLQNPSLLVTTGLSNYKYLTCLRYSCMNISQPHQ